MSNNHDLMKLMRQIYNLAIKQNKIEELYQHMEVACDIYNKMALKLQGIASGTSLFSDHSKEMLESFSAVLPKSSIVYGLIVQLVQYHKPEMLVELFSSWSVLKKELEGFLKVEVITAEPLQESDKQSISEKLESKLPSKFFIVNIIDTGIIAGMIIKVGDTELDASIAGKVNQLVTALKDNI